MRVREPLGRTFPVASLEVFRMPTLLDAYHLWWRRLGEWKHRERATEGRQIVGVQYTFWGRQLHAPWPSKPRFFPEMMRVDGWGWWPDMRRVMVLSAWESREALAAYEEKLELPKGAERWALRLRPVKVKGKIEGEQVLGEFTDLAGSGHKPGLSMTWNKHLLLHEPTFHSWVRKIADDFKEHPGALASFSTGWVPGIPYFRAFTVTSWRRLDDLTQWAYRRDAHADVIKWYGDPERFSEPWWGRFVVEESRGTLAGRDPYAGLELDPAEPERAQPAQPERTPAGVA